MTPGSTLAGVDLSSRTTPLAKRLPLTAMLPGVKENVILDCTRAERFGLRGPGTLDWLRAEGLTLPETVNAALTLDCGTTIQRLGQQEVLLTAPPGTSGQRLRDLRIAWDNSALPAKGYDAYRDEGWAWFVLSGPMAPHLMTRISMTDLRPQSFKIRQVAQTRALQQDAVVARLDRFGVVSYDLFFDIASAAFALDVLTDTAAGIGAGFAIAELYSNA